MKIGLITEPKAYTGKIFFKRILGAGIREEIKNSDNPFEAVVQVLPFSKKKLMGMSPVKLKKRIKREQQRLYRCGIEKIVYSVFIKELCRDKNVLMADITSNGDKVFLSLVPRCIRETAKKCGINLISSSICIRDIKMDRISEYLMQELCFDTKNLAISTQNIHRARMICDRFYEETGLLVDVSESFEKLANICIDVDLAEVSVGNDLIIRNVDFGFDLCGYDAQHMDFAPYLPEFKPEKIKWCYSYKK